uniref:Uncharacterized protein n=1 Tax=Rousettus aegyptiacus TaxID=9407 RepID=A0A7J8EKJ8_ROUAE|nr:hypothetical protein HJG63_012520 [Rousettus aegyptiacus]
MNWGRQSFRESFGYQASVTQFDDVSTMATLSPHTWIGVGHNRGTMDAAGTSIQTSLTLALTPDDLVSPCKSLVPPAQLNQYWCSEQAGLSPQKSIFRHSPFKRLLQLPQPLSLSATQDWVTWHPRLDLPSAVTG